MPGVSKNHNQTAPHISHLIWFETEIKRPI